MAKIKDVNKFLTKKTGLNADERKLWRDKIKSLMDEGKKEEAMKIFNSFSYFKQQYL